MVILSEMEQNLKVFSLLVLQDIWVYCLFVGRFFNSFESQILLWNKFNGSLHHNLVYVAWTLYFKGIAEIIIV